MRAMPFQWIDLYIDKYLDITSERYESQAFSMEGPVQKKYIEIASDRY